MLCAKNNSEKQEDKRAVTPLNKCVQDKMILRTMLRCSKINNGVNMIYGVILAAGCGSRFGEPKQFMLIDDKPLIAYSLDTFKSAVDFVVVVTDEKHTEVMKPYADEKTAVVCGGKSRGESLSNAVAFIEKQGASDDDIIVTHDAARPFVTKDVIDRSVVLAGEFGASSVGLKISDTIVSVDSALDVVGSVDRSSVMTVQTPQTAKFGLLKKCLSNAGDYTDLCTMLLSKGYSVKVFGGDDDNVKVTYPKDLEKVRRILKNIDG